MVNSSILIIKLLIKDIGKWISFMDTVKFIMISPPCWIRLLILGISILFRNSGFIIRASLAMILNKAKVKLCFKMVSISKDYFEMTGSMVKASSLICMEMLSKESGRIVK